MWDWYTPLMAQDIPQQDNRAAQGDGSSTWVEATTHYCASHLETVTADGLTRDNVDPLEIQYLCAKVEGYAAALRVEREAQANYDANRNCKKSDKPRFYAARERLYQARWKVAALEGDTRTLFSHKNQAQMYAFKIHEATRAADQLKNRLDNGFAQWIRSQEEIYRLAVTEPDKVQPIGPGLLGFGRCAPEVAEGRFKIYSNLKRTLDTKGEEAAKQQYCDIGKSALDNLFDLATVTDELVKLDTPTATGKTAYKDFYCEGVAELRLKTPPPQPRKRGRPRKVESQ